MVLRTAIHTGRAKRSPLVHGLAVSVAFLYIPTTMLYKTAMAGSRMEALCRSTMNMIAPGLPYVLDGAGHRLDYTHLQYANAARWGGSTLAGGVPTLDSSRLGTQAA